MRSPLIYRTLAFAAALTTVSASTTAFAQDNDPYRVDGAHLELGAFIGVLHAGRPHALFERTAGITQQPYDEVTLDLGARAAVFPVSWFGIEAEGAVMPTSLRGTETDALLYRLGGHAMLQVPERFAPFLLVGGAALGVESDENAQGSDTDAAFYWGIGAKYFVNETVGVRFDGRQMFSPKIDRTTNQESGNTAHYEFLFGLAFAFGRHAGAPPDRDEDGIADAVDACPDQKGGAPSGCPDTDGDGVTDDKDECPSIAGKLPNGCPGDTDGDGVTDDKDECIDVKGTLPNGCPDPDPDKDGVLGDADKCPTVASSEPDGCPAQDRDKDGIVDDVDQCPDVAGVAPDGCPPDADKDGVIDENDKCVNDPETPNGYQDADGCPDEVPVEVKKFTGSIKGINFRTGRSTIQASSFAVLDEAVTVLKEYPDLKVEIGGHTDSSGSAKTNQRLSQKRADAVKAYFVGKGIDESRLSAVGYGEAEPRATNRTRAGRAENRRIEFKLVN